MRGILYASPVQLARVHLTRPLGAPSIRYKFRLLPHAIIGSSLHCVQVNMSSFNMMTTLIF